MSGVYELLQVLINVQVASNNGKPVPVIRAPRPVGALHRVRQRQRFETHQETMRKLLPGKYGKSE